MLEMLLAQPLWRVNTRDKNNDMRLLLDVLWGLGRREGRRR